MITQKRLRELFYYTDGWLVRQGEDAPRKTVATTEGYLPIYFDKSTQKLHRMIFLYHHGWLPQQIDHIDNDTLNNKIENLRACTASQNQHNSCLGAENTSGVKGVTWCKMREMWLARIKCNYKSYHIGYFDDLTDAEREIKIARERLHGEFTNHG